MRQLGRDDDAGTARSPRVILGVSDSFNSGAAIVREGRIVAALSEERLCRIKMVMGWPRLAIEEVLQIAGVRPAEVDLVAVATENLYWRPQAAEIDGYFEGRPWGWDKRVMIGLASVASSVVGDSALARRAYYASKRLFCLQRRLQIPRELRSVGIEAPIHYVDHHLAHAASAYYAGGDPDATVVTLDGAGDNLSATVYRGRDGSLTRVTAVSSYDSIGNFYSYITHILGFKAHRHEGKVTGLAAYGKPLYLDRLRAWIHYRDGGIRNAARAFHTSAIEKLRRLIPDDADPADVAASIQALVEEVCGQFVEHWTRKLGRRQLGLAGGVAANVKLNQRLADLADVSSLFVFPAMGDDGLAAGAALQEYARRLPAEERGEMVYELEEVFLGSGFGESMLEEELRRAGLAFSRPPDLAARVAALLEAHQVVAHYAGRMEYGPRALGNRSILAHPGDRSINDWLNERLGRTEFMPFAPVTLEEDAERCYRSLTRGKAAARYMTITCDCTPFFREACPATVHVDDTARPQLIPRQVRSGYRQILERFRERTGLPALINTSFNMHEEPIVCSPRDAVRAFVQGHLGAMVMGPFLVEPPVTSGDAPPDSRSGGGRSS